MGCAFVFFLHEPVHSPTSVIILLIGVCPSLLPWTFVSPTPPASWFVVLALEDLEASLVSSVSGLETVPLLSTQRSPRIAASYLPSKSWLVVMMKLELCCFVEHCACLVFSAFVETGLLLVFHFLAPPPESCVHLLIVQSSLVFHQMHSG